MLSFEVTVLTDKGVCQEHIDGAGDLRSACGIILRDGLFTSDERGPIWFPPQRIKAVRLL